MNRWAGKVVVITGASAGIGLATAQAFVRRGLIVVGLARRRAKMESEMAAIRGPGKFHAIECDIVKEEDVEGAFQWVKSNLGTVHILINNAAILRPNSIADTELQELQTVIDINLTGLLRCTKQALSLIKANSEEGHIVNLNSVAGLNTPSLKGQYFNVYSATKFALRSLSETLIHELNGTKIRVCNLFVGLTETDIFEVGGIDSSFLHVVPILQAEDIANTILHVVAVPARVQITQLTIKPLGDRF